VQDHGPGGLRIVGVAEIVPHPQRDGRQLQAAVSAKIVFHLFGFYVTFYFLFLDKKKVTKKNQDRRPSRVAPPF
jgi:hypothetical protein